jgi:hypothetical protein
MKNVVLVLNEDNIGAFLTAVHDHGTEGLNAAWLALCSSRHGEIENVQLAYNVLRELQPCMGMESQKLHEITIRRLERRGARNRPRPEQRPVAEVRAVPDTPYPGEQVLGPYEYVWAERDTDCSQPVDHADERPAEYREDSETMRNAGRSAALTLGELLGYAIEDPDVCGGCAHVMLGGDCRATECDNRRRTLI